MRCTVVSGNQNYEFYYRISSFICFLVFLQLPYTKLLGCAFHYNQALYRNIQAKGLQDAYQNVEIIRQMLRQIMALAFIPSDQIKKLYSDVIKPQLNNVPKRPVSLSYNLSSFLKYYESHWLTKIYKFCVFDQPTRTNNGLEGIVFQLHNLFCFKQLFFKR